MSQAQHWDVVIIGAGLAGLTLARQLLMNSDKRVLHLERKAEVPGPRQKVGESTVQIAGYYFGKVLDLEEYFHRHHLPKYNLRFFWPTARDPAQVESYSQSYIRGFSSIPSYQFDRNRLERDLAAMNRRSERYRLELGVAAVEPELNADGPHRIRYQHQGTTRTCTADWVVDTTGRNRLLAGRMALKQPGTLHHAAAFFWVDGLVNVEKLTDTPHPARLRDPGRRSLGHQALWLATNHLVGEGFWFWIIPLKERTSLGLVYDQKRVEREQVDHPEKLLDWLYRRFPLLRRALDGREIIDFTCMRDYSHDCGCTIHQDRWALSGEAGRFSDPLYSPGSDLIAIHNSLIVDAILTGSRHELATKIMLYEPMMQIAYQSFLPSYEEGYPTLGDQECFSMKYGWELSIYFSFLVFPFMNGLFTDPYFLPGFFRRFAALGKLNRPLQRYIAAYYQWKKTHRATPPEPIHFELMQFTALQEAERLFFLTGIGPREALERLDRQLKRLHEFARWIEAHIDSVVQNDPNLLLRADTVAALDVANRVFDPARLDTQSAPAQTHAPAAWSFDPLLLHRSFHGARTAAASPGKQHA